MTKAQGSSDSLSFNETDGVLHFLENLFSGAEKNKLQGIK